MSEVERAQIMYTYPIHKSPIIILLSATFLVGCAAEPPAADSPLTPPIPEKRCGESRDTLFSAYSVDQLAEYADCTILVGHFQEDSVSELQDLAALINVRKVEGNINIFRSPGFITLHGLENLEEVDGSLYVHLNPNLESIRALSRLHNVTGNLVVEYNDLVPPLDLDWLRPRVTVGGTMTLK